MESSKEINLDAADLLVAHAEAVETAIRRGIRAALLKHQQSNNPVAIWRDGKVILLAPDEILPAKKSD